MVSSQSTVPGSSPTPPTAYCSAAVPQPECTGNLPERLHRSGGVGAVARGCEGFWRVLYGVVGGAPALCVAGVIAPTFMHSGGKWWGSPSNFLDRMVSFLHLHNKRNYKPALLSGGEQQRISVLRALIKQPKIILADEPTGSLDKLNAKIVMENIIDLSRQLETLTIVATHNVNFLPLFDLSYEIQNGKLVELK